MSRETQAWSMGAQAFKASLYRTHCPFNIDSDEGRAWLRGFDQASKHLNGVLRTPEQPR